MWWLLTLALASEGPAETDPLSGACPMAAMDLATPADPRLGGANLIVVLKEVRHAGAYSNGRLTGCWPVALAYTYNPGHKQRQGDLRTPEGWYRTSDKPWSSYYSAIAVHYPGKPDAMRGLAAGLITQRQHDAIVGAIDRGEKPPQLTKLGGEILLHGGGSSTDWTLGCVAFENTHIDAMRKGLAKGTVGDILILP